MLVVGKLALMKLSILAIFFNQLSVVALFYDVTIFHNKYQVRFFYG